MAHISLVSKVEINDHKQFYTKNLLCEQLAQAGWSINNLQITNFQLGYNILAIAKK